MKYVALGSTGVQVSQMCLGTMMFGERCDRAEADRILGAAVERGITFIDTAAMYGKGKTEEILGEILKGRRDTLFITTKVHDGVDGKTIRTSIDASLKRMQLDAVDLYMIHWPQIGMHPVEMMEALNDVVAQGKTRYVGFCNCPAWLFAHYNAIAVEHGWARLVCNQVPYNLLERGIEVEVLPQALAENIAITTYRALLAGLLAGKYTAGHPLPTDARGQTDPRIPKWLEKYGEGVERLKNFAAQRGVPTAHAATAWVSGKPGVTCPIVGVSSLDQVNTAIDGFEFTLTPAETEEITAYFDTAVKEETGGKFPELRRELHLLQE